MNLVMDSRTRAKLRRADPWEVRGAYQWVKAVKGLPQFSEVEDARLMGITPLIAQVREDSGKRLGMALRGASEARVRRLLASDREDVMDQLARAVRLAKCSVSVQDLAVNAIYWGERCRRQIARDYFGEDEDDGQH